MLSFEFYSFYDPPNSLTAVLRLTVFYILFLPFPVCLNLRSKLCTVDLVAEIFLFPEKESRFRWCKHSGLRSTSAAACQQSSCHCHRQNKSHNSFLHFTFLLFLFILTVLFRHNSSVLCCSRAKICLRRHGSRLLGAPAQKDGTKKILSFLVPSSQNTLYSDTFTFFSFVFPQYRSSCSAVSRSTNFFFSFRNSSRSIRM